MTVTEMIEALQKIIDKGDGDNPVAIWTSQGWTDNITVTQSSFTFWDKPPVMIDAVEE